MTPLCELAKKYKTDKGGRHQLAGEICHDYTPAYWDLFKDRAKGVRRLLEIGVNTGASLFMWEEFFPNAEILGIDCLEHCLINRDRIRCVQADQGSHESLLAAMAKFGADIDFDIIVDDGSHQWQHQVTSFKTLLPFLSRDGVYIVEDLEYEGTSPESLGKEVPPGFKWDAIHCARVFGPPVYTEDLLVITRV